MPRYDYIKYETNDEIQLNYEWVTLETIANDMEVSPNALRQRFSRWSTIVTTVYTYERVERIKTDEKDLPRLTRSAKELLEKIHKERFAHKINYDQFELLAKEIIPKDKLNNDCEYYILSNGLLLEINIKEDIQ